MEQREKKVQQEEKMPDRRQRKTRAAILAAFTDLLSKKSYGKITVQEIIDLADVGRTTFYAHFETKDDLLQELCTELFDHIIESAKGSANAGSGQPESVFSHLLQHLDEDKNISALLLSESGGFFMRYFKERLDELVELEYGISKREGKLPREFLVNHISGSFVEMVQWWLKGHKKYTPEELGDYFNEAIEPVVGL